jgi:hypothetical protein
MIVFRFPRFRNADTSSREAQLFERMSNGLLKIAVAALLSGLAVGQTERPKDAQSAEVWPTFSASSHSQDWYDPSARCSTSLMLRRYVNADQASKTYV